MQFKTEQEASDYQAVSNYVERHCRLSYQPVKHWCAVVDLDKPLEAEDRSSTAAINKLILLVWNKKESKEFILKPKKQ